MNKFIEKILSGFRPSKDELKAKLKDLRKKRYNARKAKEHHVRGLKKAVNEMDMKEYLAHCAKRDYWHEVLEKIRGDILIVKDAIKAQKVKEEAALYSKKLKAFDKTMLTGLKELLLPLDNLVETQTILGDINGLAGKIYQFYEQNKKGFAREDMAAYHQLGLLSVKIRCANITEKVGDAERISSLRGRQFGAQKREHVKLWSRILANQVRDCLKTIKGRSE